MNPKSWHQDWQLGLTGSLSLVVLTLISNVLWNSFTFSVKAQIIPDETLGAERSIVTPIAPGSPFDQITGGASRGVNLFHSFEQFNIAKEQYAYFMAPAGIENILSRVTGGSRSEILGTLKVEGEANLFLINPNGISFGSNASLDMNGSFVATTADAIQFGTQGFFSASVPDAPPVLTVNPSALLFNQLSAASITHQSVEDFRVINEQSLLLVGGDVELLGGTVKVEGGRIELGGVAEPGVVGLEINDNYFQLSYSAGVQKADILLTNGAQVIATGGDIQLSGRHINLTESSKIIAEVLGSEPGGNLTLTASESVEVVEESSLSTQTNGSGAAGNLTIETGQLIVRDGAQVGADTFSEGEGGTLTVTASGSITVSGTSADGQKASGLFTQTNGSGAAGNLTIETGQLIVQDGAQIGAGTFSEGEGGSLTVTASDSITVSGTSADGQKASGLFTQTEGAGDAGNLRIETGVLIVQDGGQISASTLGEGNGGKLTVNASEFVQLSGTSAQGNLSGLFAVVQGGSGDAGELKIETGQLIVQDGAVVTASTSEGAQGRGGTLTVIASESIELSGTTANGEFSSGLFVGTTGSGAAGDLTVNTLELTVRDGAVISVRSLGSGQAGKLSVTAGSIQLDNGGSLSGTTLSGNGGDITLQVQDLLLMRDRSTISTSAGTAQAGGDGGNIKIDANFIVAVPSEDSDISANAYTGRGGNIQITTQSLFGIQFRPEATPKSDITASSTFGIDGTVQINTPEIDPSSGLTNLPTDLVDASNQIAQNCRRGGTQVARNEFIITGRGGLPNNPSEVLSTDTVWADLRLTARTTLSRSSSQDIIAIANSTRKPLVEAQGWLINDKGKVVLMAQAVAVLAHTPWQTIAECPML